MKKKYNITFPIINTLICIAPYIWHIVDILEGRYDRLLFQTIIIFPLIVYVTLVWIFCLKNDAIEDDKMKDDNL